MYASPAQEREAQNWQSWWGTIHRQHDRLADQSGTYSFGWLPSLVLTKTSMAIPLIIGKKYQLRWNIPSRHQNKVDTYVKRCCSYPTNDTSLTTGGRTPRTKVSNAVTFSYQMSFLSSHVIEITRADIRALLGAELAGTIEADIVPKRARAHQASATINVHYIHQQQEHSAVYFELVMIIEGRNLRYLRGPVAANKRPEGRRTTESTCAGSGVHCGSITARNCIEKVRSWRELCSQVVVSG